MASPSELSLDCKPHSYSMLLKSFGDQQTHDQLQKLEEFLSRLEEERLKIDAFKRELPLCMQLLSNAVETSRQQLQAYKVSNSHNQGITRPVLEEFIPLKNSSSQELSDKANWMTTAQLWSQANNNNSETKPQPNTTLTSPTGTDIGFSGKLGLDTKQRNGGAFLPFSKDRNLCPSPTLALANSSDHKDIEDKKCSESSENAMFSCNPKREHSVIEQNKGVVANSGADHAQVTNTNATNGSTNTTSQTQRKARRCWSPDLHRKFVNALQMLGGSQVATPKQIRELMKVDGLTNDEVKSHLQKFRLHTRRPSPSPQATGPPGPSQVLVGIWVPPEYATAHSAGPTIYHQPASHAPPPHFCAAPPPAAHQDFYAAVAAAATPPPPPHHQLNHLHHQLLLYKATSQAQSSPESENRGTNGGDRSESIEDGKSESSSWKAESGENGVERKGLAALRDEGEESNGSEITLKF